VTPAVHVEVRRGAYRDSVALMAVSRAASDVAGVQAAAVAMGTDLNLGLIAGMGFTAPDLEAAGPDDLVIVVRADDAGALTAAREAVEAALAARSEPPAAGGMAPGPPRTTAAAAGRPGDPPPTLALVSVPGEHAFTEAMDALRAGLHVMVFSDNVAVDQELALKQEGARRGLLVMGPDCGTAIVAGVGLGFANVVRPGPVGIVGASGTGTQQLCCLLDAHGVGVRHALGVGGRDLSAEIGGRSAVAALAALDADPGTELIVVVSKPPAGAAADRVRAAAESCATPVVFGLLGPGQPDLSAVAAEVVRRLGREPAPTPSWGAGAPLDPVNGPLIGLFAGGTLCDEAMIVAGDVLGPIASNVPLPGAPRLGADLEAEGHLAVDFGDDELTRGRPHPMIDQRLRMERIAQEARRGRGAVLLLDVVLGHAAHPDPAAELAPALADARDEVARAGATLHAVVSLCGTTGDPQGLEGQAQRLADAGASVHLSNAEAARTAAGLVAGGGDRG
jgi:FdrA protein